MKDFNDGLIVGAVGLVTFFLLCFVATNLFRPLQDMWWNKGFVSGYDRALSHCREQKFADCGD